MVDLDDDFEEDEEEETEESYGKVHLRIQKAKKRDIGRNIIRIDHEVMERLNIKKGDVCSIKGKTESAGIAWPSYPQDSGLNIVRIDSRLRKNTGASIDDVVELRKVNVKIAKNVILAPSEVKIRSNPRFESFVKRKLENYPVTLNNILSLTIGISREVSFKVIGLNPKGFCIINESTMLHISENIIKE
ncbi:hypothetical protein ES706_04111 [subsurface metagenome]